MKKMKGLRRYYRVVCFGDSFFIEVNDGCCGGWSRIPIQYCGNAQTAKTAWEDYKASRRMRGTYDIHGRRKLNAA